MIKKTLENKVGKVGNQKYPANRNFLHRQIFIKYLQEKSVNSHFGASWLISFTIGNELVIFCNKFAHFLPVTKPYAINHSISEF